MVDTLRASVPFEEFDYQTLLHGLRHYARPRDRITRLLAGGAIVRVKKGLYVFGPTYRRRPFSLEVLANLISGPSYVSFEYALGFWGLIPEHVNTVTSATVGRTRAFQTPVGRFTYRPVPRRVFAIGVLSTGPGESPSCLRASPEKALCDTLVAARGLAATSPRALERALQEDLRIDSARVRDLDAGLVRRLAERWPSRRLVHLAEVIARV